MDCSTRSVIQCLTPDEWKQQTSRVVVATRHAEDLSFLKRSECFPPHAYDSSPPATTCGSIWSIQLYHWRDSNWTPWQQGVFPSLLAKVYLNTWLVGGIHPLSCVTISASRIKTSVPIMKQLQAVSSSSEEDTPIILDLYNYCEKRKSWNKERVTLTSKTKLYWGWNSWAY